MALISDMYDDFDRKRKVVKDDDGKILRLETDEELKNRLAIEKRREEERNIKRIMEHGFTRQQASYLRLLEQSISEAARTYVPPPVF